MDYVKMINFSSETNNKEENLNNNLANLDNLIQENTSQIKKGTSPFNLNKDNNIDNNIINASSSEYIHQKDGMNEITPISNSKTNNNHSGNSNIFSETTQINALINIPNNNMTQTEEEISNLNNK